MTRSIVAILSVLLFYILTYAIARMAETRRIRFWRGEGITPMSVKESLDSLPTALCYYWPEGLVKLSNTRMNVLCRRITGAALSDAAAFWNALSTGTVSGSEQGGDAPIVTLPDGSVVSFRRGEIDMEGATLYELTAVDVTEEYRLTRELAEKERQAVSVNRRLRALQGRIKYVMMDKEALATKVRIHDQIGRALLLAKRYILRPGSVPRDELLRIWRLNILLLQNEGTEAWQEPYFAGLRYAEALGVALEIDGELPTEDHLTGVINTAITVHLTNVLRHAHGEKAFVVIRETPENYILTFTNDGDPPRGEAREAGGLVNLRREAESIGGEMVIESAPRFRLILTLPKEGTEYGV